MLASSYPIGQAIGSRLDILLNKICCVSIGGHGVSLHACNKPNKNTNAE
jgi:hypothetical protein